MLIQQPTANEMTRHWLRRHSYYVKTGNAQMQNLAYKLAQFWYARRCVAEYAVVPVQGRGLSSGLLQSCEYTKAVHLAELLEEQINDMLDDINRAGAYNRLSVPVHQQINCHA